MVLSQASANVPGKGVEESSTCEPEIIAVSKPMCDLLRFVQRVAVSEASCFLIQGESGTGKDLVATMLHKRSLRREEPFLALNCAAIPDTLLESELFGYERGAFTDARSQKRGLFELADHGTLFLDEIREIPRPLQAKLLRVIEKQVFRHLGGLAEIKVDLRIIAATNTDLRNAVHQGAFREDLFYRLNIIPIVIPPLRERAEDILPLARFFVKNYNQKYKLHISAITEEAESVLLTYGWPGNVRELRNAIEHAMIVEETDRIRTQSLPIWIGALSRGCSLDNVCQMDFLTSDGMSLVAHERALLVQALERTKGNQTQAARLLQITRDTLRYKMKKFNLR